MGLEQYDPYAIKSYSFTVRKTNSFFSFPTVLLSLLIIAFSVAINLNTVRHLWIPLQELQIKSSESRELPQALTDTLLCAKTSSSGNKNRISVFRDTQEQLLFPLVTEEQVTASNPELAAQIGTGFGCLNLAGLYFSSISESIYIEVQDPSASIYVQGNSLSSITSEKKDAALTVSNDNTQSRARLMRLTFFRATKYDRLYLNYQPEVINTIDSSSLTNLLYQDHPFTGNYSYFAFILYQPVVVSSTQTAQKFNYQTISFTRHNIGEILGAVLSWASIMVIVIGFLAAPLMDYKLDLLTVESLFHLQSSLQNPSLLKFIIANIKSGIFLKQDQYVLMCQKIQRMKDVDMIVKLQLLFSRLVPKSRRKKTHQVISSEQSFNQVVKNQIGISLYSDKNSRKPIVMKLETDQKPQNCLTTLRKKILYFLDSGSDNVSINYKNQGIGSKRSFFITIIAIVGLLSFMVIFGLLQSNTLITRYQSLQSEQTITIPPYHLFLMFIQNDLHPDIKLMDGNFAVKQNLTFSTHNTCLQHLTSTQITYFQTRYIYFICNPQPIQFVLSQNPTLSRYLNVDQTNISPNADYALYVKKDQTVPNYRSMDSYVRAMSSSTQFYMEVPLVKIISETPESSVESYQLELQNAKISTFNKISGQIIKISQSQLIISEQQPDFFQAVENIWTFTVILFTVIVMKITKYTNLQEKQQNRTAEKAQFRDSICIFLAKTDGLLHGRHRSQLQSLKYYTKQQMPLD